MVDYDCAFIYRVKRFRYLFTRITFLKLNPKLYATSAIEPLLYCLGGFLKLEHVTLSLSGGPPVNFDTHHWEYMCGIHMQSDADSPATLQVQESSLMSTGSAVRVFGQTNTASITNSDVYDSI